MYCKYKDIFGKVKTGAHSYRIANIAIVDVAMTVLFAYIISLGCPTCTFYPTLLVLFLLGIVLHRLFCVRTTIDRLLFG